MNRKRVSQPKVYCATCGVLLQSHRRNVESAHRVCRTCRGQAMMAQFELALSDQLFARGDIPTDAQWLRMCAVRWGKPGRLSAVQSKDPHIQGISYFLRECTRRNCDAWCAKKALFETYAAWCETQEIQPVTAVFFNRHLHRLKIADARDRTTRYWIGLRLKPGLREGAI